MLSAQPMKTNTRFSDAIADIRDAVQFRRLWLTLATEEIGDQHRRTFLGPLWLLLNYLVFVGAFLAIFGARPGIDNFPLYVATGMLVWLMIQEVILQGVNLFRQEHRYIKGTQLPLSVYVLKLSTQSLIRFGYASLGWLGIMAFVGIPTGANVLESIAGLLIVLLCIPPTVLSLAMAGAFLPDLSFVVSNLMRVGVFLTPIFWAPLGDNIRSALYAWNPFTHLLEIVRMPLLEGSMPLRSLIISSCILVLSNVLAFVLLAFLRRKVVHVI